MSQFEHLIDPTNFGTIARYLKIPQADIHFVFHLREREMISPFAEELRWELETAGIRPGRFPRCVENAIVNGTLKVSARNSHLVEHDASSSWYVHAHHIDPYVTSWVLYYHPVYIVHTPGLFEGQVMQKEHVDSQTFGKTGNQAGSSSQTQSDQGQTGSTTATSQSQSQGQGHGQGH